MAGALGGLLFAVFLTACGSSVFLHRSPQHGRINAENEPSPRHGAHGAWPTGNQLPAYLSVRLPCHLCAPAFSPFSTVCQSRTFLALSGQEGHIQGTVMLGGNSLWVDSGQT